MVNVLKHYSNCDDLSEIDGRTMEVVRQWYLKNKRYHSWPSGD